MAGPLLYKPAPKWQILAALGAAVAIHAVAAVIANIHAEIPEASLADIPEAVVEMSIEQAPPDPQPTPPPEEPEPVDAPPEPITPPEFTEEQPTPPPKRTEKPKATAPIARPSAPAGPVGPAPTGKAAMIYKPNIVYPYEARRTHATGSGVVVVSVSPSGSVTDASMGKSTGSSVLDNAAVSAFRNARFKPGTVPKVKIPITFTLTGASY